MTTSFDPHQGRRDIRCLHHVKYSIRRIQQGKVTNARISNWVLATEGLSLDVMYAEKKNNHVAQGVAELHDCAAIPLPLSDSHHPEPARVSSNHKSFMEADCFAFPKVY
ncbi:hypothetical protein AAFF_G00190560 [Aldrovandia affinis]|uniref:Uncharacterized protein n=1 Tax=Aldrovandia affinis TaxID=143900 RepID=A0AAD7RJT0_9TELE|nr:hypothetical protein AAFF_G00190560 [Aldrovandia affinis]